MKKLVFKLLCNSAIDRIVKLTGNGLIPNLRTKGFRFKVPYDQTTSTIRSSLFWGFYESAETRLLRKYLRSDISVIELGGSLGVVSSYIVSKLNIPAKLVVIEANCKLIDTIKENVSRHNSKNISVTIVNKAISYYKTKVFLNVTNNNTTSRITDGTTGQEVQCIKLNEIVDQYNLQTFSLVCDIEGTELEILQNDSTILKRCNQIFIELHKARGIDGKEYSTNDLLKTLVGNNFSILAKDGNVILLKNNRIEE